MENVECMEMQPLSEAVRAAAFRRDIEDVLAAGYPRMFPEPSFAVSVWSVCATRWLGRHDLALRACDAFVPRVGSLKPCAVFRRFEDAVQASVALNQGDFQHAVFAHTVTVDPWYNGNMKPVDRECDQHYAVVEMRAERDVGEAVVAANGLFVFRSCLRNDHVPFDVECERYELLLSRPPLDQRESGMAFDALYVYDA